MRLNRFFITSCTVVIMGAGLHAQTDSTSSTVLPATEPLKIDSAATTPAVTETPIVTPADSLATTDPKADSLQPVLEANASPSAKPMSATSQAKALKKANMLYNKKAYSEAIPYY